MIRLDKVTKIYYNNGVIATGFSKISLELNIGEFVVIVGESGSGKSTLLNVISGLDTYEEGEMYINGKETSHYTEEDMQEYRRRYVSNIFQAFNLINSYTVRQNVELALVIDGKSNKETRKKVNEVLKKVGLWELRNRRTTKLSGGQKQRVAIARALVQETPIIVCDEPTGNLDSESAKDIFKLLREVSEDKLVVVVTHNFEQVKDYATRVIKMKDGSVYEDTKLKDYKVIDGGHEAEFNKINLGSLIKISITNAISTPIKLILSLAIFIITACLLFNEIGALHLTYISTEMDGVDNFVFADANTQRIVVSKKDKSIFTDEEVNKIKNIDNVESVFLRDQDLDVIITPNIVLQETEFESIDYQYPVLLRRFENLDPNIKLIAGRMPEKDDEMLLVTSGFEFREYLNKNEYIIVHDYNGRHFYNSDSKIVGLAEKKYHEGGLPFLYMKDKLYDEYYIQSSAFENHLKISIDDEMNTTTPADFLFNSNVPEGTVWITDYHADIFCDHPNGFGNEYDCSNNKVILKNNTPFYTIKQELPVSQVLNNNNYRELTNNKGYYDAAISENIYVNPKDFKKLAYVDDIYQISVYAKEGSSVLDITEDIKQAGDYYVVAVAYTKDTDTILNFAFKVVSIMLIIGAIAIFSLIAYFLLKFILKSRIAYYAVIRMLGGNINTIRRIVRIELFLYAIVSFIITGLGIFLIVKKNIFDLLIPATEPLLFVEPVHYIYVFAGLLLMSFIIARRFTKKVFTESMINTYNMEV